MKYILLPIGRFLLVFFAMFFFPIILLFAGVLFLWDFKKQKFVDVWDAWFKEVVVQNNVVSIGEKFYYYKTPIDYLCLKKSYKIKYGV